MLREHWEHKGRDYDEIETTVQTRFDLAKDGERVDQTIEHLHELAALGSQLTHGTRIDVGAIRPLELMAERVLPTLASA